MNKLDVARKRLTGVLRQTPKVILCYEAGYDGFLLARFLEQRGIECLVMEPASLQPRVWRYMPPTVAASARFAEPTGRSSNAPVEIYALSGEKSVAHSVQRFFGNQRAIPSIRRRKSAVIARASSRLPTTRGVMITMSSSRC